MANLIHESEEAVQARLAIGAPLLENGVLSLDRGGSGLSGTSGILSMTVALSKAMSKSHADQQAWVASLLGRLVTPSLPFEDFAHLGVPSDLARRLLTGWREQASEGLNVMLFGQAGTGKTEFAKALAAQAGLKLWSVGEAPEGGDEPGRSARLAALRLSFSVLRKRQDTALLLDEAEDVLLAADQFGSKKGDHSKLFLNRTLEGNPVPVIWACNDIGSMDPASIRRMDMVIEVKVPDHAGRSRIWGRVLAREGLELGVGAAARLASRWRAPAAVTAKAARAARLSGGGEGEVEVILSGVMSALGSASCLPERDGKAFDPELTRCSDDLLTVADRVSAAGAKRQFSMLLSGPPGCGKSEYARYLAGRMGLGYRLLRASDIFSKWVGESEKNIAEAFTQARMENEVLVIDEVDSLLPPREGAERSWEVSQVNEMLTWMEDHPLPFIATSNSLSRIDSAAFRRFVFKLNFQPLDQHRGRLAFLRIFKVEPPDSLVLPEGLTPGDFSAVSRKAAFLGEGDPMTLARWLEEEAEHKVGVQKREIGFRPIPSLDRGVLLRAA